MTTGSSDIPDPADDGSPGTPRTAGGVRRAILVLLAVAVVCVVLGLVAVVRLSPDSEADPLDQDVSGPADLTFDPSGCRYEPERGGLVVHFTVETSDAGRFAIDVSAVTEEGADDQDISTPHVVRYVVPFYGGRTKKEFDVVVPLTDAEHRQGYRKCRWSYGDE